MKKAYYILIFTATAMLSIVACAQSSESKNYSSTPMSAVAFSPQADSLLTNIQDKIEMAMGRSIGSQNPEPLTGIQAKLQAVESTNIANYWDAYIDYYLAVYYMITRNNEKSEAHIQKGIDKLENEKSKTSEDYALLATLQNLSIRTLSGMKAAAVSAKVKKSARKALKLDENNIRAYYALASNDFYTPEKYGGGNEVENYLLKAIELPDQTQEDAKLPKWGKAYSYQLLVRYYLRNEDTDMARKYFEQGRALYPHDQELLSLGNKLEE